MSNIFVICLGELVLPDRDGTFQLVISEDGTRTANLIVGDDYYKIRLDSNAEMDSNAGTSAPQYSSRMMNKKDFEDRMEAESKLAEPEVEYDPSENLQDVNGDYNSEGGNVLDIMMVYTSKARIAQGGSHSTMSALCAMGIENFKRSLERSAVIPSMTVELVYCGQTANDYSENSFSGALSDLRNNLIGLADSSTTFDKRDELGADAVFMMVDLGGSCGLGYNLAGGVPSSAAYSIGETDCSVFSHTFEHEVGHNMGLKHDRSQGTYADFSIEYGFCWDHPTDDQT